MKYTTPDGGGTGGIGRPMGLKVSAGTDTVSFTFRPSWHATSFVHVNVVQWLYEPLIDELEGYRVYDAVEVRPPALLDTLFFASEQVVRGDTVLGTVVLEKPAVGLDHVVLLECLYGQADAVEMPDAITIPVGLQEGYFDVYVKPGAPKSLHFSAKQMPDGVNIAAVKRGGFSVIPPHYISSLTIEPDTVVVGQAASATLKLAMSAPEGGLDVEVRCLVNNTYAGAFDPNPLTVSVPAGETEVSFALQPSGYYHDPVEVWVVQDSYYSVSQTMTNLQE